ncbi:MAG: CBS domain-containing protein [Anaerolineae bacterium]|nr:CBS domain-containing protein [Anaerolineae bacterium]
MLVKDVMTPNPITVRPGSDPLAGVAICKSGGFSRLPVVDDDGKLIGIVTENDLKLFLSTAPSPGVMKRQHRMDQVMRSPAISISPDYPLEEAARVMVKHNITGLPVVDETNHLVGIITHSDIFAQLADTLGAETDSLRVTVQVPNRPGELAKLADRIAQAGANICSVVTHCAIDCDKEDGRINLTLRLEGTTLDDIASVIRQDPAVEILYAWQRKSPPPEANGA